MGTKKKIPKTIHLPLQTKKLYHKAIETTDTAFGEMHVESYDKKF
jgi:hypothetical protein